MPKQPTKARQPDPSKVLPTSQPGQTSVNYPPYFQRYLTPWAIPMWAEANMWRRFVRYQPVAMVCRDTLIANFIAQEWKIQARESSEKEQYAKQIKEYTRFFEDFDGMGFAGHMEWVLGDLLDLPFGGASEVGRMNNDPEGSLAWVENIDAATLFPTNNGDFPIGQRVFMAQDNTNPMIVYFPKDSIDRIYWSPRSDIYRRGWGMPPPEKIYLAIEMLSRGDQYYANMLLDTPEAGILDLGDMSATSAKDWVESFKTLMAGIDPLKIPVLYEHENEVKYIPFGKPPSEIMYDETILKYASIVCAGYGMSLADVGLNASASSTGERSLAGTIRSERRMRRNGISTVISKATTYLNKLLPSYLEFAIMDYDDEILANIGRARLASAQAFMAMMQTKVFTPDEVRQQWISDGLVTVPMDELAPNTAVESPINITTAKRNPDTSDQVGDPVPAEQGGWGGITQHQSRGTTETVDAKSALKDFFDVEFSKILSRNIASDLIPIVRKAVENFYPQATELKSMIGRPELEQWKADYDDVLFGYNTLLEFPEEVNKSIKDYYSEVKKILEGNNWWKLPEDTANVLKTLFASAFASSLQSVTSRMLDSLHTKGLMQNVTLPDKFSVSTNVEKMAAIAAMAAATVAYLNDGTEFFVENAVYSAVKDEMTSEAVLNQVATGATVDDVITPNFLSRVIASVLSKLKNVFADRADTVSDFELEKVYNSAAEDEMMQVGLAHKSWRCMGDNPCDICLDNQAAGLVPMDYQYNSVFGPVASPLAHGSCHCEEDYDEDELQQLAQAGQINFWFGE
jgi:hypothetical protein